MSENEDPIKSVAAQHLQNAVTLSHMLNLAALAKLGLSPPAAAAAPIVGEEVNPDELVAVIRQVVREELAALPKRAPAAG